MKNKLFIFFLLYFLKGYSQTTPVTGNSGCAAVLPANYMQLRYNAANTQNLVNTLNHDICVNKKLSIVFYIIADSSGNNGVTQTNLNDIVNRLNRTFKRICVSFMNCSTVIIPVHPYNRWSKDTIDPVVTKNWYAENTINFYIPKTILGEAAGYAYYPGGKDVIVVEKASMADTSGVVAIHEMGHFLGLPHTFAEISSTSTSTPSQELVNRSNCTTKGDGFCDTEADGYPQNSGGGPPCNNSPGAKDANNDYYISPVDNYMSYFNCRCRFSQEQYNFMATILLTQRHYLH